MVPVIKVAADAGWHCRPSCNNNFNESALHPQPPYPLSQARPTLEQSLGSPFDAGLDSGLSSMVFGGRFNSACHLCRKRRVKCDEGRPGCRRCQVYGQPCPGYSDTFHFAHQKPQPPQPSSRPRSSAARPVSNRRLAVPAPIDAVLPAATVPPVLAPPEELVSLCYFMNRFACRAECTGLPGYLNFLYSLYDAANPGVLELSTLSAARMVAFNRTSHSNKALRDKAYRDHGLVVREIRKLLTEGARLSDSHDDDDDEPLDVAGATRQALSDRTLGAVLMLSIFGLVNDEAARHVGSHSSGIYYLLTRRGRQQSLTSTGRELIFLCMIYLQADAGIRNDFKYCNITSMGILPDGKSTEDPMTQVVPNLSLLCRLSKPLRATLPTPSQPPLPTQEAATLNLSRQQKSNNSSPASSAQYTPSDGHGSYETPDTMLSSTPGFTGSPQPPTPQLPNSESRSEQIRSACMALEELESWDHYANQKWPEFYQGRVSPPLLGQSRAHTSTYHSETASTVVLMRGYRMRFSLLLLAVCEQIVREISSASGPRTSHGETGRRQTSLSSSPYLSPLSEHDPHHSVKGEKSSSCSPPYNPPSINAISSEELLSLAKQTIAKLEHEIPLAIDDMMHCIPFVLGDADPVTGSLARGHENEPAKKGFEVREPLRLIASSRRFATEEQRRQSWVNLVRVHEIAGMRAPELIEGMG
ncbi:RNA polymerase II-specific transcription factor-like protein [Microdochium nivale]|nr:RNA polymerase II-specific transcription factor-like protein [Microdochium nivale]